MLRKGHGGLKEAPKIEEKAKSERLRRHGNQIMFIDLRFERWCVFMNIEICLGKHLAFNSNMLIIK